MNESLKFLFSLSKSCFWGLNVDDEWVFWIIGNYSNLKKVQNFGSELNFWVDWICILREEKLNLNSTLLLYSWILNTIFPIWKRWESWGGVLIFFFEVFKMWEKKMIGCQKKKLENSEQKKISKNFVKKFLERFFSIFFFGEKSSSRTSEDWEQNWFALSKEIILSRIPNDEKRWKKSFFWFETCPDKKF